MTIKILVVEDDPLFGRPLCQRLERSEAFNATVQYCEAADQAIEAAQNSDEPFDLFLLDQRLQVDIDGIELLTELKNYYPDADFIVFTGLPGSTPNGDAKRAFEAGAYHYLRKPFRFGELEWQIKTLLDKHEVRRETNWTRIILDVGNHARGCDSIDDLAQILVAAGRSLGFQRARYWQRHSNDRMECLWSAGHQADEKLEKLNFHHSELAGVELNNDANVGVQYILAPPKRLKGKKHKAKFNFDFPSGEKVALLLGTDKKNEGLLVFDNGEYQKVLSQNEKHLIELFSNQASAVLLAMKERRQAKWLKLINEFGSQVNKLTDLGGLSDLSQAIYQHVANGIYAPNAIVAIKEVNSEQIKVRLHVVDYKPTTEQIKNLQTSGMLQHVLNRGETLLLPEGTEEYRRNFSVKLIGKPAKSWVGVPLHAQEKIVGAIILEDDHQGNRFTEEDRDFLESIADLAASAVHTIHQREREAWRKEQLRILHYASELIIQYASDPKKLWSFVLAIIHIVCVRNPVDWIVYLKREGRSPVYAGFRGLNTKKALNSMLKAYWDESKVKFGLAQFATDLESDDPRRINQFTHAFKKDFAISRYVELFEHFFAENQSGYRIYSGLEVQNAIPKMPKKYVAEQYALFSLHASPQQNNTGVVVFGGSQTLGSDLPIEPLKSFINQVALAEKEIEDRKAIEDFLAIQKIISEADPMKRLSLKEQLSLIAKYALGTVRADRVVIHPVKHNEPGIDNSSSGWAKRKRTAKKPGFPRENGLSDYVLYKERYLFIPDASKESPIGDRLKSANRKSLIAFRIEEPVSGKPLGVFYTDFNFELKQHEGISKRIESFVHMAGNAIQNAHIYLAQEKDFKSVMAAYHNLLDSTNSVHHAATRIQYVQDSAQVEKFLYKKIIQGMKTLLGDVQANIRFIRKERILDSKTRETSFEKKSFFLDKSGEVDSYRASIKLGISGRMFQSGQTRPRYEKDVRLKNSGYRKEKNSQFKTISEFDVPVVIDRELIGIWNLESPKIDGFPVRVRKNIEAYSQTTKHIIRDFRLNNRIRDVLDAVKAVTDDLPPEEAINIIGERIFEALEDVETMTIWYTPKIGNSHSDTPILLGYDVGGAKRNTMLNERSQKNLKDSLVTQTMAHNKPRFLPDTTKEEQHSFIKHEKIKSAVNIPLRSGKTVVGAMFIGYRRPKSFSTELRSLISLCAEIVAASIRDAVNLSTLRDEKERQQNLLDIIDAVGHTLEMGEAIQKIIAKLQNWYPEAEISILSFDNTKRQLQPLPQTGDTYTRMIKQDISYFDIENDKGGLIKAIAQKALASKQTESVIMANAKSSLVVGFVADEKLVGVLSLDRGRKDRFNQEDEKFVENVSELLAVVMTREEHRQALEFNRIVSSRTAWASEVAHESKNEIGLMLHWLRWLGDDLTLNQDQSEWLHNIEASVKTLRDLLNYSSIETGLNSDTHYDLARYINKVAVNILEKQGSKNRVTYTYDGLHEKIESNIPQPKIHRILRYLVHNALDAIKKEFPNDGGRLKFNISSVLSPTGSLEAKLTIENNGALIKPEHRSRILQSPITSNDKQTRGYGLMFTKMIVKSLDGDIWLDSGPDEAVTRFALRVPLLIDDGAGEQVHREADTDQWMNILESGA